MRKQTLARTLLTAVCVIGALSVGVKRVVEAASDVKDDVVKEAWGNVVGGAELGIFVDKNVFSPCEPIIIVVKLKAVGGKSVGYEFTGRERDYRVSVKDKDGKDVPLTRYGARMKANAGEVFMRMFRTLDANQEATEQLLVNRSYDMTLSGRYTIVVDRSIRAAGDTAFVVVQSGTLNIEVQ